MHGLTEVEQLEAGRWQSFETSANPSGYRLGGTPLDALPSVTESVTS